MEQKLLTESETAYYIKMSKSFLRKSRCEGLVGNRTPGPPYMKIGRAIRYSVIDLDNWLQEHKHI